MKKLLLLIFSSLIFQKLESQNWQYAAALDSLVFDKKYHDDQPGFAVVVVENGQIMYEKQRGLANLKQKLPIRAETMFNIGSITKQFTAAAIFILEERGLLKMEDEIQKYLPELPNFGARITLENLMAHTSGIPDHFEVANMQGRYKDSFCGFPKMVELLRAAPELGFAPGSDFAYCNTGYMLLAMVVERISGMDFHGFLQKNVFEPLEMQHTNCFQKEAQGLPDGTTSYAFQAKNGKFKHTKPWPNALGATGIQTTMRDFLKWDKNFSDPKIFSPATLQKMLTTGNLNDGSPTNYGGGLLLKPFEEHRMVSHGGGWSSFLTEYRRFPDVGISILVASNNDFSSPFPLADAICRKILPKKMPLVEPQKISSSTDFQIQKLAGNYLSASNFLRKIVVADQQLQVEISQKSKIKLQFLEVKTADNALIFSDGQDKIIFQLDEKMEHPLGFWWTGGHYFRVKRFYQKLDDAPADPKIFTGKYRNDLRKFSVRVAKNRRGHLVLKPVFFKKYPLEPLGGNVFRVRGETIVVRFLEGEMMVGNDWANGLRMKKR